MRTLFLLLFLQLGTITSLVNITAYDCATSESEKIGTYDITKISDCKTVNKWYPKKRNVNVQVIHYPVLEKMNSTVCSVKRTVEITQCGLLDGIRYHL